MKENIKYQNYVRRYLIEILAMQRLSGYLSILLESEQIKKYVHFTVWLSGFKVK